MRVEPFVYALAFGQLVSWGVLYYAFSVLLVPMQQDLGWSRPVLVGGFTTAVVLSAFLAPAVGRLLDRGGARRAMATGSVAGAALVLAWSRVSGPAAFYAVWAGIGVTMSLVLYEPAFTVVAKRYAPHHRKALTAVTLIAGLASFVFQPLASALTTAHGWRTTLVVLAVVLGAVTVPLHLVILRPGPEGSAAPAPGGAAARLDDGLFWPVTFAFAGSAFTSFGASVLLVAYLVDEGWTLGGAAFAGGVLGAMQLPGRMLFGALHARLPPTRLVPLLLGFPAVGVVALLAGGGSAAVWAAVVVLGMTQGMTTLLRVTLLGDLYGAASFGAVNGKSATPVVLARALAPLAASGLAARTGGHTVPLLALAAVAVASAAVSSRALGRRASKLA